ncbi:MAG: hypothetical protein K9L02_05425 [Acholeplasmataceae bacterium]|nr:hypothetical protein [Acholeplasmataceae bacterium]
MKKNIAKKIFLVFFFTLFLFISIASLNKNSIQAIDYQRSSSWYGSDLEMSPQTLISFDSNYRYFSEIIDSTSTIVSDKTYIIETAYDLFKLSELCMGTDKTVYLGLDYALGNDIDYYEIVQENINQRFHPIGFLEPFTGSFDGQGFEITNLYFDTIISDEYYQSTYSGLRYVSMFSKVSASGYIHDIGLINPIIIQPIEWGVMAYVSALVGENYGTVDNTYLIDYRGDASGFNAEGAFKISGLVSINYGVFTNSFVSSEHIRSLSVVENDSTSPVLSVNQGTILHLYYDQTIYADVKANMSNSIGLETPDFQSPQRFDSGWFYNDHYLSLASNDAEISQLTLQNTYPILQGLDVSNDGFEIDDAIDFIYMNELLLVSGAFRSGLYSVVSDIDMNQISSQGYVAASVGFSGTLTSTFNNPSTVLYERESSQGGDISYHAIINLKLNQPTYIGNYSSYAFFSSLFGTVSNLNFVNSSIYTDHLDDAVLRSEVLIGTIAGQMNHGIIDNVHIYNDIVMSNSQESISRLSLGGLVGKGSGHIIESTSNGSIEGGSHPYSTSSTGASIGGIVGTSDMMSIEETINSMDIQGLSYINITNSLVYVGGIVGYGTVTDLTRVVNQGHIIANQENQTNETIYIGGIFGLLSHVVNQVSFLYNDGSLSIHINHELTLNVAGVGIIESDDLNIELSSLTNSGHIMFLYPNGFVLTELELSQMNIYVSGVLITDRVQGTIEGLFNEVNMVLDIDLIDQLAGTIIVKSTNQLDLFQLYNTGNITLSSNHTLTQDQIIISGNVIGSNLSLNHMRNEGNITIDIDHETGATVTDGALIVVGLLTDVSQNQMAQNGYNGGNITLTKDELIHVDYDVYISGIAYSNSNTNLYQELGLLTSSIDIVYCEGSMDHFLNDGNIDVRGNFDGSVRASGILMMNTSLLTSSINLGDIDLRNDATIADSEVEASGIVYLMNSEYAQLRDSANYGDIKAVSHTSIGYAHASGIALRNDRLIDGTDIIPGTTNQLAKILFTINYGDVYAYNATDESTYTITNETRSKASGILTIGLLSVINNVNYGNIYSKYLASGIFGFLYLNKFGTISTNQVFVSNSINYGKVRQITGYDQETEVFTIEMGTNPTPSISNVFAAFIGKIHTGTTTWAFAGDVTYPIDRVYFGYLINFDEKINMFSLAPTLSTTWADGFGNLEDANNAILNMLQYMATTNPNDQSAQPFTYFYSGGWIGQYMGKVISYYDVTDSESGMFYEGFAFRSSRPIYTGTDQYIRNFIEYIPVEKVNPVIISKVEADTGFSFPGIYALSSSKGIENGIFIPDNFDLTNLHPHTLDEVETDTSWLGNVLDPSSISYQLFTGMRQIKANFATSIYDMELKQVDENGNYISDGMVLDAPIIDSQRGLITYYLPSNAAVLAGNTSTLMDVYSFVEVSQGLGRMVPDVIASGEQTYTWVGDYKKSGSNFVEIGPYHTTGIYNPTTPDTTEYLSSSRNTPVYSQTALDANSTMPFLYNHTPHTRFLIWWTASGYRLNPGTIQSPGYGAYETYTIENYPTLYRYVGPSQELVTYIRTEVIQDVVIYDPSTLKFKVNNELGSYTVSEHADIHYEGSTQMTEASVPRSFGIYDSMYNASNEYIDGVEDHYGSIRIYSASYNPSDPSTYRDYDIRIIRTADQSLTDLDTLLVDGINAIPSYIDFRDISSTQTLNYERSVDLGVLSATYTTLNIANQTNVLPWIAIYDNDTGELVDPQLYVLSKGSVNNTNSLNNRDGTLGSGTVTIDFEVTPYLPSGSYRLEFTLVTNEVAKIYVDKIESSDASIIDLIYDEQNIALLGDIYTSYIPFGIYYDVLDESTNLVNFTNLESLINVYYTDLESENIPSYLNDLVLSPFSTLVSIDFNISLIDSYRHQYQLTYTIEAEDGTIAIYYHHLIESTVSVLPSHVYKNGGEIELDLDPIELRYLEAPTIRVEFDLATVYGDFLTTTSDFVPTNIGGSAIEDVDFFITHLPSLGYEVDFNQHIELGIYTFTSSYQSSITLWGETIVWDFDFQSIQMIKIKNDDSQLQNIMFVSDTIYSGFNTIVDIEEITDLSYMDYLLYPELRVMTVLPTTGIYYGEYTNNHVYWVIGQVQKTNLNYYLPTFVLPDGAMIRRVTDFINVGYDSQSENLASDFSPFGNEFNYVLYRVYAHDYDENQSHYTDYYVAVQDMTNNIRFNLEVINESSLQINDLYVRINVCQLGEDYTGDCSYQDTVLSMTSHSLYDPFSQTFENNQFQTTMYGTYQMTIDTPDDIGYTIKVQSTTIFGTSFYLEDSILPRKYYITITLIDQIDMISWGQVTSAINHLSLNDIDIIKTYVSGELFTYEGVTYRVQTGYTYSFDVNHRPGTDSSLGLIDISRGYDAYSTYVIGDIVYYLGNYYESLLLNEIGVAPDAVGIVLGYWNIIT